MYTIPSAQDIRNCHERIKPYIIQTPLKRSQEIDEYVGAEVWFKCENLQKVSAFKARGALNAVLQLSPEELNRGLVTHSSGNHAQALAFAGNIQGVKTWVVMPETAPKIKIDKVTSLGAKIIFCKNTPEERQKEADKIVTKHGATFVHPFDNDHVIIGQATVGKEILEEKPDIQAVIPPVGGGGLLSGTGLSAHYFGKDCKVYAAEPDGAADAIYSFETGRVEKAKFVNTIADGLQTHLSKRTLNLIRAHVENIFLVSDDEILHAMRLLNKHLNQAVEPSAAVSFAALIRNKAHFKNTKVGVILTGGNIDNQLKQEYLGFS